VVDLSVALIDGSYHTVDSSDMAFRTAGRIGIVEGLPQCQPVLLEPIHLVEIVCPNEATAKINALMSSRRGQILGFDTREGWDGWDMVRAKIRNRRLDRGNSLGDCRRRYLHIQIRSHGRTHRPHRGPDRRRAPRRGVIFFCVIPDRREASSPESITTVRDYGFRAARFRSAPE
jgi:hypothetical protein